MEEWEIQNIIDELDIIKKKVKELTKDLKATQEALSEEEDEHPEVDGNRLPKRFAGNPKFPSRRARDWALDDAEGAQDQDVASLGAAMASAVSRWAARTEEDDFAYHMRRARGVPRRCLHSMRLVSISR